MDVRNNISDVYKRYSGHPAEVITLLPQSGSDRKYFRITDSGKHIIGAYNKNREENDAFIGFTKHFASKKLPVPEIYDYFPVEHVYFIQDLGEINLYTWLQAKTSNNFFDDESVRVYKEILDNLILFQTRGIEGLDLDLCYPHRSFDRQSMMWDMNYFKYMFLKLIGAPFNEKRLENDFNTLAGHLLEADQNFFLYRDFQSANVMIFNGKPWFIDYQGGRKGALQYDVASLLFDAKVYMPQNVRDELVDYYIGKYGAATGEDGSVFRKYFAGYIIIRLMQALGAFGFRGLYENKPTFTESIVPAVTLLVHIIESETVPVDLHELFSTVKSIPLLDKFRDISKIRQ